MASIFYRALFKNNYAMLGTVFVGAFVFEIGYNSIMDRVWDNINRGRQWKDIRHKYIESTEDEE